MSLSEEKQVNGLLVGPERGGILGCRQKKSLAEEPGKFLHQYLCVKVPLLIDSLLRRVDYCPKRLYKCN